MFTAYIKSFVGFAIVLLLAVPSHVGAKVEWSIQKTLKTGEPPVDVAVSPNGSTIFVLTGNGNVLIYDREGKFPAENSYLPPVGKIKLWKLSP